MEPLMKRLEDYTRRRDAAVSNPEPSSQIIAAVYAVAIEIASSRIDRHIDLENIFKAVARL